MNPHGIDIGSCLSRSWDLYKQNFGLIFFSTLVVCIAASAAGGIPYVGIITGPALNGVFYGGLFYFYLKLIRGEKADIQDAFAGFQRELVPLMLASLATTVISFLAMMAAAAPVLITLAPLLLQAYKNPENAPDLLLPVFGIGMGLNLLFCLVVAFVCYLLWVFAFPLILDRRLPVWEAMETSRKMVFRNFAGVFGLGFVAAMISLSGVLACCIGIFFTLPVFFGSFAFAYEDLFSNEQRATSNEKLL